MGPVDHLDGRTLYQKLRGVAMGKGPAVFRSVLALQPATGWAHPVLRAALYSDGRQTWDSGSGPGPVISELVQSDGTRTRIALIQSVEARGHRFAQAIRQALGNAGAGVPLIELYRLHPSPGEWEDLLVDSYTASHHVSDAAWREAQDPGADDGPPPWPSFWQGRGSGLDPTRPLRPAELLRRYPLSLLLGYDPRSAILSAREGRAGRKRQAAEDDEEPSAGRARSQARPCGRVWRSEITAKIDGLYQRTQSLVRERAAMLDATIYVTPDGGWTLDADRAKQENGRPKRYEAARGEAGRPSAVGLDTVTPSLRPVPDVWANSVTLTSYLSLAGVRQLRFSPDGGSDRSQELNAAGRTLVAAIGVAGTILSESDLRIRTDCDLVIDHDRGGARRQLVGAEGAEEIVVDERAALDALGWAADGAAALRVDGEASLWEPETLRLVARDDYAKLVAPLEA